MDTIRLLQILENYPDSDVIQYHVIASFLKKTSYKNLISLANALSFDLHHDARFNKAQKACIAYMFRDFGYAHLKPLAEKQRKELFFIDGKHQTPGHFLEAIDFAKRSPKDNQLLMRFGLSLLLHSPLPKKDTQPKIDAIEQLLTPYEKKAVTEISLQHQEKTTVFFICYNLILLAYCLKTLTLLHYPSL